MAAPASVEHVLSSPGSPLDPALQQDMGQRFGYDFGWVRVHTDAKAAESAQAVDARAFTVGHDVVFGTNQYRPQETDGRHLIAHELAHVVQQAGNESRYGTLRVGPTSDIYERQADQKARTSAGRAVGIPTGALTSVSSLGVLQRAPFLPPGVDLLPPIQAVNKIVLDQLYAQALVQLQKIDPTIYGYLSKATLNGPSVVIRTATGVDASQTPPVTIQFTFNLQVKSVSLPSGRDADFESGPATPPAGTGTSRTFTRSMTMQISPQSSVSLAQSLYHEGLHMLIYMDKFLPTSPHTAGLANYKKIAKAQPDFARLSAELEVFIELDLLNRKLNTPGAASRDADMVLQDLWEEKYVWDQEKAKFATSFSNAALASQYIMKGLGDVGIHTNPSDRNLISIVQKATVILDAIDQQVGKTPATPAPTP